MAGGSAAASTNVPAPESSQGLKFLVQRPSEAADLIEELQRKVKAARRTQLIPILMLTNVGGIENEIAGIGSGADEFLTKPLDPEVVRTRIRAMLRNKAAIDSRPRWSPDGRRLTFVRDFGEDTAVIVLNL